MVAVKVAMKVAMKFYGWEEGLDLHCLNQDLSDRGFTGFFCLNRGLHRLRG